MKTPTVQHISDTELTLLQDGELDLRRREFALKHLDQCPECSKRLAELGELCCQVHDAALHAEECSSDGAFWLRLAGRLDEPATTLSRKGRRPWLNLLPPFILAGLGAIVDMLVTAVLVAYTLVNIGILPDFSSQVMSYLQNILSSSRLMAWLAQLGLMDSTSVSNWLSSLNAKGITGNELALALALLVLLIVLALITACLFIWNAHLTKQQESPMAGAHAIH